MNNHEGDCLVKQFTLRAKEKLLSIKDEVSRLVERGEIALAVKLAINYLKSTEFVSFLELTSNKVSHPFPNLPQSSENFIHDFYLHASNQELDISFLEISSQVRALKVRYFYKFEKYDLVAIFSEDESPTLRRGTLRDLGFILSSLDSFLNEFQNDRKY